jgi:autotransporter-associated beta strand protein
MKTIMLKKLALVGATLLAVNGASFAETLYWNTGTSTFLTAENWSIDAEGQTVSTTAPTIADDIIFTSNAINEAPMSWVTTDAGVNSLTFSSTWAMFFRSSNNQARHVSLGAGGITVSAGAGAIRIGESSNTINLNLQASQSWVNNSASQLLIYNGINVGNTTTENVTLTMSANGSGSIQLQNTLNDSSGGGILTLVIDSAGTGTVNIGTNIHTFSGGAWIKNGVVTSRAVGLFSAGQGDVTLGDDAGTSNAILNINAGGGVSGGGIIVKAGSSGSAALTFNVSNSDLVINGAVTLGKDLYVLSGSTTGTMALNGTVSGTGGIIKSGAGVLKLAADNTYTGNTTVSAGTLEISAMSALGASTANVQLIGNNTGVTYTGDGETSARTFELASAGNQTSIFTANGGGAWIIGVDVSSLNVTRTLTLTGTSVALNTVASDIVNPYTGKNTVVNKTGEGVWALTGSNSYSGVTIVSAGTLLVNGDNSGAAGAVNVNAGATLGGSGTIGGVTTINSGTLTVGEDGSAAILTFNRNLTLSNSALILGVLGVGVNDTLALNGTSNSLSGDLFLDFAGSAWSAGTHEIYLNDLFVGTVDLSTLLSNFSAANLLNHDADLTFDDFNFTTGLLKFNVIPEPSALALLVGGGGILVFVISRRRRG